MLMLWLRNKKGDKEKMSETKTDIKRQLKYMEETKDIYLSLKNPNRITEEEFNKRIKILKRALK